MAPIAVIGDDDNAYHYVDQSGNVGSLPKALLSPDQTAQLEALKVPDVQDQTPSPAQPKAVSGMYSEPAQPQLSEQDLARMAPPVDLTGHGTQGPSPASVNPAITASMGNQPYVTGEKSPSLSAEESASQKIAPKDVVAGAPASPFALQGTESPITRVQNISRALGGEEAGVSAAAKAGADRANAESAYLDTMAKNEQSRAADMAQREKSRESQVADQMQKYGQMRDDLVNQKIDPQHFWASKDTGQKVLGAIAIALGGIGAAMTHSQTNPALEVINAAINRDIDAQKANLATKRAGVEAQGNLVGMMRAQFADQRQADLAAHAMALDAANLQLKQIASKYTAPEIQGRAQQLSSQIETQRQQTLMQLEQSVREMNMRYQAAGGAPINPEFLNEKDRERYVPGVGFTADKETARKVADTKGKIDTFQQTLNDLQNFAKQHGNTILDRPTVAAGKALAANAQDQYRQLQNEGVFRQGEAQFISNIIPSDPTSFYEVLPQLDQAKQLTNRAAMNFYKSHTTTGGGTNIRFTPGR